MAHTSGDDDARHSDNSEHGGAGKRPVPGEGDSADGAPAQHGGDRDQPDHPASVRHTRPADEGAGAAGGSSERSSEQGAGAAGGSKERSSEQGAGAAGSSAGTVSYDSLNTMEKESLAKRLRKEILKDEGIVDTCCYGFLDWLREQFSRTRTAKPPSPVLFANMEYLTDNSHTRDLFANEGSPDAVERYYKDTVEEKDIDYKAEDLDIHSLARATMKYIREHTEFFDDSVYKRLAAAYETGEQKEYIIRRLPFVMCHRDVFQTLTGLVDSMERDKGANNVGKDGMLGALAPCAIFWRLESVSDPISVDRKKEILHDLTNTNFDEVPTEFYNKR